MFKTMSYALLNNDKILFTLLVYDVCIYSYAYNYVVAYIMFSDMHHMWQGRLKLTFNGRALVFM